MSQVDRCSTPVFSFFWFSSFFDCGSVDEIYLHSSLMFWNVVQPTLDVLHRSHYYHDLNSLSDDCVDQQRPVFEVVLLY